jgi:hypothetical protein
MRLIALLILACFAHSGFTMTPEKKIIYGYVEKATLVDKALVLSAKLDTGAKSASLSAVNIQEVTVNGVNYLRFTVPGKQGNVSFLSEYIGKVKIKVRAGEHTGTKSEPLKRPVVLLRVRIGDMERTIPVNLTNRKRFIYPLLLGRDAINAFSGLVDPSTSFLLKIQAADKDAH